MIRSGLCRGLFLSAAVALACLSASAVRADDSAANPKYTAWAKFKPGSSATIEADMDMKGNKFHIKTTRTLVSIDADKAVVETKSTVSVMGHDHDAPAQQQTIAAKGDPESFKQTGEKDIEAMGKTFKCKVYDAKGNSEGQPNKTGPGNPDDMKATVYVCDEVPGGLVRLDGTGRNGTDLTFILTAMESK